MENKKKRVAPRIVAFTTALCRHHAAVSETKNQFFLIRQHQKQIPINS